MVRTETRTRTRTAAIAVGAALALGLGACGEQREPPPDEGAVPGPDHNQDDDGPQDPGDDDDGEAGAGDDGNAGESPADEDLPGEVIEIFPFEGDELSVVVVAHDDVLNVREIPDPTAPVQAELDPLAE